MTWITGLPGARGGIAATPCTSVTGLMLALKHETHRNRAGHIEGPGRRLIAYVDSAGQFRGNYQTSTVLQEVRFPTGPELAAWLFRKHEEMDL